MNRQRLSRPSLKIVRRADPERVTFTFEVWNPFVSVYQPVDSFRDGLRRVGEMADLIGVMWLQRHPKHKLLVDVPSVPSVDVTNPDRWSEFCVIATTSRSYDTRRSDQPGWVRAPGMTQAAAATCASVGYLLPTPNAKDAARIQEIVCSV